MGDKCSKGKPGSTTMRPAAGRAINKEEIWKKRNLKRHEHGRRSNCYRSEYADWRV